ncbi:efflux RND transporter permease subunit [Leucobacter japonicus]|uniref:efflux RND transporter permease subunit n=1 Tax=Leucobacter japonicus TaxID=1461259 RepID=UPI0006A7A63E|nr:efflux RND transporter permease subunit [Leucobacter japonicus]
MHLLTALSLKNRALIALVTIVAAVFGLIGVGSLKQELMPSVQFPTIAVVTSYPGASPEVVNKDVSVPIETALRGVPQLESSSATSSTGTSTVLAQFTYGVDLASTEQKVERAISRISQMLPDAADTQVVSGSIDDFPIIQIAVTPAEGETPESTAALAERTAIPDLSDIDGVRDAQITGARTERITITPNFEALAAQGLSAQTITDTLQQSGVLIAAGSVTEGDRTLAVQAGTELHSADEIAALPLAVSAEQLAAQQAAAQAPGLADDAAAAPVPATIGAVATVSLEPGPETSISRVNGASALTIAVTKTSAANTVDVSHAVQAQLSDLEDQLGGAQLTVIFDQAPYVEQSIETLTTEGLLGLVFAVLVILVFLMSIRATLVTAISIPTSVLLTFVGLNFADYTLNLLTLGALTISIGRVVDDSIVVIENIKRHLTDGGDRAPVIIAAVREVAGAITASTITTVAVFLPMAFVGGMVGELFRPFAFTVTIALIASLLVSLTIVPVLAYWFLRTGPARRRDGFITAGSGEDAKYQAGAEIDAHPTRLQRWYRPIIEWTLHSPLKTLAIALAIFIGTVGLAATPLLKTNFIGSDEQNSVGLVQNLAPGTSLDTQLAQAEKVEQALDPISSIESVQVTIGSAGGAAALFGGGGDGAVNYSITTNADANQAQAQDDIRAAVDALDDAGTFSISQSGGGVTGSSAIEVNVTAPDQDSLAQASDAVVQALSDISALQQVESDLGVSRQYLAITVDRTLAAQAGLTEAGVAGQVAQQMQPAQIGQITIDANTVAVYLANGVAPTDAAGVSALTIQTASGPQALSSLATVQVADGPVTVRTQDGARSVTVSALPQADDLGSAGAQVSAALESIDLPQGAKAEVGGVLSQQSDAFQQLGLALLAAILIVYVVMVATFRSLLQPLLLLISVPFAATGTILLLIATGIPLGVASLIGVLMLVGIVVTNAIVLIDLVNQYRVRGDALRDAVLHGSLQRLRPIVMTALATILALTPMALGITGKGGFISQPLAVVVIGGLLSSTVLTLVVLPTLYYLVERRRETGPRRRSGNAAPDPRDPTGPLAVATGDAASAPQPRRRRGTFGRTAVSAAGAGASAGVGAGAGAGAMGLGIGAASGLGDAGYLAHGVPEASPEGQVSAAFGQPMTAAPPMSASLPTPGPESEIASDSVIAPAPTTAPVTIEPASVNTDPADDSVRTDHVGATAPIASSAPSGWELLAPDHVVDVEPTQGVELDPEVSVSPVPAASSEPAAMPVPGVQPETAAPSEPAASETPSAPVVDPEPHEFGRVPENGHEAMGPSTQQMSMDLSDLGFTGTDNPLSDLASEPDGTDADAVDDAPIRAAGAHGVPDAPTQIDPEPWTAPDPWPVPEPAPAQNIAPNPAHDAGGESQPENVETSAEPEPEPDLTESVDAVAPLFAHSDIDAATTPLVLPQPEAAAETQEPAPPVTGELNWEQLMWQATQEVDEAAGHAADPGATEHTPTDDPQPTDSTEER